MDNSLIVSFNANSAADLTSNISTWAALEQVKKPNSAQEATVSDVFAMVGYAKNGKSARDYIQELCSSLRIVGDVINIDIDFYVWVSSMDLPYTLTVNNTSGSIGPGTRFTRPTSFNIIFNHTDAVDVGRLFDGTLKAEMPFFADDGSVISPSPTFEMVGSNAVLSEKATTVLRANGTVEGYKHTLTISLGVPRIAVDKSTRNTITYGAFSTVGLEASIRVAWGNCDPDTPGYEQCIARTQDNLKIDIPACVKSLLNACVVDMDGDGDIDIDDLILGALKLPSSITNITRGTGGKQIVWWDTCTGKVIKQKWKPDNE